MERWERRSRKLERERERMPKHGQSLAALYANAIRKRAVRAARPSSDTNPELAATPTPSPARRRRA